MPALATEIPGLVWESSMEKTYATEFNVDYYEGGYALIEVIDSARYLVVPEACRFRRALMEASGFSSSRWTGFICRQPPAWH